MKLLKIENSQGHFLKGDDEYVPIDKISKEDLLRMVDLVLTGEVEFDEYDSSSLQNQAHQIIYLSIYGKLRELSGRRTEFVDESERLYLEDYEKYKPIVVPQEGANAS